MTEQPSYDPNSLADYLDSVLPPGTDDVLSTGSDPLVEAAALLANTPKPALSPEALTRIQTQVLAAHGAHPLPKPASRPFAPRLPVLVGGAAAVVMIVVVMLINGRTPGVVVPASTATSQPIALPTAASTLSPTLTIMSTETPFLTVAATPAPPTSTATQAASETSLPDVPATFSVTLTPTELPVSLVLEGPVEAINGNVVTVYGVEVEFPPDAPILSVLQVGDRVRVEGGTVSSTIVAVNTTVENADVAVNSQSGAVWRDTGDCRKPPPDWAPANGWRRRCQGATKPGQPGKPDDDKGMGMGMGMGG
jgi:hypothetical protein